MKWGPTIQQRRCRYSLTCVSFHQKMFPNTMKQKLCWEQKLLDRCPFCALQILNFNEIQTGFSNYQRIAATFSPRGNLLTQMGTLWWHDKLISSVLVKTVKRKQAAKTKLVWKKWYQWAHKWTAMQSTKYSNEWNNKFIYQLPSKPVIHYSKTMKIIKVAKLFMGKTVSVCIKHTI